MIAGGCFRRQVLVGQLKVVIPGGVLAGSPELFLLPHGDPLIVAVPAGRGLIDHLGVPGDVGMRRRRVRQHQLVRPGGELEEVIDPFFFRQAREKIEVRLAVLRAVLALLEVPWI